VLGVAFENIERLLPRLYFETEGVLVKIMYNAMTTNQSHVSHFTYDKNVNDFMLCFELFTLIILIFISLSMYISFASLIKPLRLLILVSYPSSSLLIR